MLGERIRGSVHFASFAFLDHAAQDADAAFWSWQKFILLRPFLICKERLKKGCIILLSHPHCIVNYFTSSTWRPVASLDTTYCNKNKALFAEDPQKACGLIVYVYVCPEGSEIHVAGTSQGKRKALYATPGASINEI